MESVNSLCIPRRHEPAKVVEFKVSDGDSVEKDAPLLLYEYRAKVDPNTPLSSDPVLDQILKKSVDANGFMSKREYLKAPFDGKITAILCSIGDSVKYGDALLEITQPCGHDVVFNGLCSICGKDMTSSEFTGTTPSTANINMSHDAKGLRVSYQEATRLESETMQRLWRSKKLSLIIDLDQTIIHAFATQDPNFENWLIENYDGPRQEDQQSSSAADDSQNIPSLNSRLPSDIGSFVLPDSPLRYYIKLRPALRDFLEKISRLYEMHIYTMGTRHYAEAVAATIDPEQRYFKERILSRDESGSMTHKTLRRLFPCDTSMVVALDDRADVWMWSPNLIKVQPYQFFSGVGDINSGMLPQTVPIPQVPKVGLQPNGDTADAAATSQGTADGQSSLDEEQLRQDSERLTQEHKALVDNDLELVYMENVLTKLHQSYYARVKPNNQPPLPDVTTLLPSMKRAVLKGTVIVFTAVIPIHPNAPPPQKSDLWRWAEQFGARCELEVTKHTTHVVAGKKDTAKVHKARRHLHPPTDGSPQHKHHAPTIVVSIGWLIDSMSQWSRMDEMPYLWYEEDRDVVEEAHRLLEQSAANAANSGDSSSADDEEESGYSDALQSGQSASAAEQPPASVIESMSSFIVPSNGEDQLDNAERADGVPDSSSNNNNNNNNNNNGGNRNSSNPKARKRKSSDLGDIGNSSANGGKKQKPQSAAVRRLKAQLALEGNADDFSGNTTDLENEIEKQEADFGLHEAEVEDYLQALDWDDVERELDEFMNESDSDDSTGRSRPQTPDGRGLATQSHGNSAVNLRQMAMRQARKQRITDDSSKKPDAAAAGDAKDAELEGSLVDDGAQTGSSDVYGESSSSSGSESEGCDGQTSSPGARHRTKRRRTSSENQATSKLSASDGNLGIDTNEDEEDGEDEVEQARSRIPKAPSVHQRLARSVGMSESFKPSLEYDDGDEDDDEAEFESAGEDQRGYQEDNEDESQPWEEDNDDDNDNDNDNDDDDDDENFDDFINELEDDISRS